MEDVGAVGSPTVESRHHAHVKGQTLGLVDRHHADHAGGLGLLHRMTLKEGDKLGDRTPVGSVVFGGGRQEVGGPSGEEGIEVEPLGPRTDRGLVSLLRDHGESGGAERFHTLLEEDG